MAEGILVQQVVEDEQALEPPAERHAHRQHRFRQRQRAETSLLFAVQLGPHDVHAALHALRAVRVSVGDVLFAERDALQLLRVVAHLRGEDERVGLEIADEERALLGLRHELEAFLDERVQDVAQPLLAIDRLDDLVEAAQLLRLAAHFRLALADLLGPFVDDALQPAALGPELLRADAHEAEQQPGHRQGVRW